MTGLQIQGKSEVGTFVFRQSENFGRHRSPYSATGEVAGMDNDLANHQRSVGSIGSAAYAPLAVGLDALGY